MKEIYTPNLFRYENLMELGEDKNLSSIPYFINFDVNNQKHFSALIQYDISKIMENILLFDRVYVDSVIFPVIIDSLYKQDKKGTVELLKKGYLSFLNFGDIYISTVKGEDNNYLITAATGRACPFDNAENLKKHIFSYGEGKRDDLRRIMGTIFKKSKKVSIEMNQYSEEIVRLIDSELKKGVYKDFGIGIEGNYVINDSNKGVFDAICQVVKSDTIASILGIENIYYGDFLLEISKARLDEYQLINQSFNDVMRFERIPDICSLYLQGNLNISDIVKLKSSKESKAFASWFMKNKYKDKDFILQDYYHATKRQSKLDSIPMKGIRYIVTGAVGLVPEVGTVVGAVAGAVDSFLLDEFKSKTPNMFFETIKRKVKKNDKKAKEIEEIIIPIRKEIVIDLVEERWLDSEKLALEELNRCFEKILATNNKEESYVYYEKARQIFIEVTTKNTLIIFLKCLTKISEYDEVDRLQILEFITSYILLFIEKNDRDTVLILRKSYMLVLISSINKEGFSKRMEETIVRAVDTKTFYEYIYNLIHDYSNNKYEHSMELAKIMSAIYMYLTGNSKQITDIVNIQKIVIKDNELSVQVIDKD